MTLVFDHGRYDLLIDEVVLGQENAPRVERPRASRHLRQCRCGLLANRQWELEPEGRTTSGLRADPDLPAHELDEAFADRKAEARAAVAPGNGGVGLREPPKEKREFVRRDADSRIGDFDAKSRPLEVVGGAHDDAAPLREFDRVGNQVEEDLP